MKETAGQVLYENYAKESGLPFVSFRPQYIYGRKSNKFDYIDWYFDRIVRGAPLPIPGELRSWGGVGEPASLAICDCPPSSSLS